MHKSFCGLRQGNVSHFLVVEALWEAATSSQRNKLSKKALMRSVAEAAHFFFLLKPPYWETACKSSVKGGERGCGYKQTCGTHRSENGRVTVCFLKLSGPGIARGLTALLVVVKALVTRYKQIVKDSVCFFYFVSKRQRNTSQACLHNLISKRISISALSLFLFSLLCFFFLSLVLSFLFSIKQVLKDAQLPHRLLQF